MRHAGGRGGGARVLMRVTGVKTCQWFGFRFLRNRPRSSSLGGGDGRHRCGCGAHLGSRQCPSHSAGLVTANRTATTATKAANVRRPRRLARPSAIARGLWVRGGRIPSTSYINAAAMEAAGLGDGHTAARRVWAQPWGKNQHFGAAGMALGLRTYFPRGKKSTSAGTAVKKHKSRSYWLHLAKKQPSFVPSQVVQKGHRHTEAPKRLLSGVRAGTALETL